jgi:glycosyltransferase involved in cell wall biosynthesis
MSGGGQRDGLDLLVLNLGMDAGHPALGHVPVWTDELARRCRHVTVITMFAGAFEAAPNLTVHSLGKELGRSEPRRLVEFYRMTHAVLRERPIDVCFAHMAPLFACLFAPVARRHRIPTVLWYSHGSVTNTLRVAHRVVDRCLTTTPAGFPLPSDKLHVVGHGVDTAVFAPLSQRPPSYESTLLQVGRVSRIKGLDQTLRALRLLVDEGRADLRLRIVGTTLTAADREYAAELDALCASLGLHERIAFDGPAAFRDMPARYHQGQVLVNLMESSLDKTILEGAASGCIPVSTNAGFRVLAQERGLEQLVPERGAEGLALAIGRVLDMSPDERQQIATTLRRGVAEQHSLDALMDRVVGQLTEVTRLSRPRRARARR